MSEYEAVLHKLGTLEHRIDEVRHIVTSMQLSDAESRGDLKVVVGKLDNAATALANAAQSIQRSELAARVAEDGKLPVWAIRAGFLLLGIIIALVGAKEVLPVIARWMAGGL